VGTAIEVEFAESMTREVKTEEASACFAAAFAALGASGTASVVAVSVAVKIILVV
jgi:hypothetical protein